MNNNINSKDLFHAIGDIKDETVLEAETETQITEVSINSASSADSANSARLSVVRAKPWQFATLAAGLVLTIATTLTLFLVFGRDEPLGPNNPTDEPTCTTEDIPTDEPLTGYPILSAWSAHNLGYTEIPRTYTVIRSVEELRDYNHVSDERRDVLLINYSEEFFEENFLFLHTIGIIHQYEPEITAAMYYNERYVRIYAQQTPRAPQLSSLSVLHWLIVVEFCNSINHAGIEIVWKDEFAPLNPEIADLNWFVPPYVDLGPESSQYCLCCGEHRFENHSLTFCHNCDHFTGVDGVVDERTLQVLNRYHGDHTGTWINWVYDPERNLFGSCSWYKYLVLHPTDKFNTNLDFPDFTNPLLIVHEVDSSVRVECANNPPFEFLAQEAYTGRIAVARRDGSFITGFEFEGGGSGRSANVVSVVKDGKHGVIDSTGEVIVPFILDRIMIIDDYTAFARVGDFWGILAFVDVADVPHRETTGGFERDFPTEEPSDQIRYLQHGERITNNWSVSQTDAGLFVIVDNLGNRFIDAEFETLRHETSGWDNWLNNYTDDVIAARTPERPMFLDGEMRDLEDRYSIRIVGDDLLVRFLAVYEVHRGNTTEIRLWCINDLFYARKAIDTMYMIGDNPTNLFTLHGIDVDPRITQVFFGTTGAVIESVLHVSQSSEQGVGLLSIHVVLRLVGEENDREVMFHYLPSRNEGDLWELKSVDPFWGF
jgi:hypothetical protein